MGSGWSIPGAGMQTPADPYHGTCVGCLTSGIHLDYTGACIDCAAIVDPFDSGPVTAPAGWCPSCGRFAPDGCSVACDRSQDVDDLGRAA